MSNQSIEVDVLFMAANQTIVIKFRCTLTLQRKRIELNVFANWWPILKFFEGVMAILEKKWGFSALHICIFYELTYLEK